MTIVGGCLPPDHFKTEFGYPHAFGNFGLSSIPAKPPRHEAPGKPIEHYENWLALVYEDGEIQMRSSLRLRGCKRDILHPSKKLFKELIDEGLICSDGEGPQPPPGPLRSMAIASDSRMLSLPKKMNKRRHHAEFGMLNGDQYDRPRKKMDIRQPLRGQSEISIRLDDIDAQRKWFSEAFKAVQQVGCRTIAKVWIKKIHPKKQSTHPYNGGLPRDRDPSPNRTRPPYWPAQVIHKEPDHIDRNQRTALLVSLISQTPIPQMVPVGEEVRLINAQDLLMALEEKKSDFKDGRWNIVEEIVRVRSDVEAYKEGNLDGNSLTYATDYSEVTRASKSDPEAKQEEHERSSLDSEIILASDEMSTHQEEEPTTSTTPMPSPPRLLKEEHGRSNGMKQQRASSPTGHPLETTLSEDVHQQADRVAQVSPHGVYPPQMLRGDLFVAGAKAMKYDPTHSLRMQQDRGDFSTHSEVEHYFPPWSSQTITESPTDFQPLTYHFNGLQSQSPMEHDPYQMTRVTTGPHMRSGGSMNAIHGMPMLETGTFQAFVDGPCRQLPLRGVSSPHGMMIAQENSELGYMPPNFFAG